MELQNLFATVVNMTLTGSIVIGVVLPARLALGRGPKVFAWALWLVVLFRLCVPCPSAHRCRCWGRWMRPPHLRWWGRWNM